MVKNRKSVLILLLFWSTLLMVGCVDNKSNILDIQKDSDEKIKKEQMEFPVLYEEYVDETLSFHASVEPPIGLKKINNEIQITYKTVDFDMALKEFFSNMGELKKEEMILQPENSLYQSAYNTRDEFVANSPEMFRMEKVQWMKVKDCIELSKKDLAYNAEVYSVPQIFDFGTVESVWKKIKEKIEKLGVAIDLKPTFFYMDYKTMKEEKEKYVGQSISDENWDENDNGYFISATQCIGGNTVYANTYFGTGIEGEPDTANVLVYVDEFGIHMLELNRIINQIEESDKTWEMLSLEELIDAIKKRFGMVITGDKVNIKEIKFSYLTEALNDKIYRLLPVWFCNYEQITKEGEIRMQQLIINASTGEEVLYELY